MPQPGIPNELVLSTSVYGPRLNKIEDQAFSAVAMGFRKLELGLAANPSKLEGWEDATRETGITAESVVVGALNPLRENMSGSFLGATDAEARERAMNSTRRHIRLAQRMGAPVVIVRGCAVEDPSLAGEARELGAALEAADDDGRPLVQESIAEFVHKVQKRGQRQLEHFCRSLHALRADFPETRLAVEPGMQFNDLLNFEAMQWVLDDLASQGVGYWHDTGRIHLRGRAGLPGQGPWLDAFASRMMGLHLSDATPEEEGLPPGMGEVDFQLVSEYLPPEAPRVVEVGETHGRPELLACVQFLLGRGF